MRDYSLRTAEGRWRSCLWQTGRIVLIEVWEHLRGYRNWTPAMATVESSTLSPISIGEGAAKQSVAWQSVCKIAWLDQHGVPRTAEFEVFEESPLYQLCDGETIEIRFNPNKPDQFYLPGLVQSKLAKASKLTIFAAMFILVLIGIAVVWFGPDILSAISH